MEKDFTNSFDKDKNGKLDKEEMKSWLFPDDDFSQEEPKTLIILRLSITTQFSIDLLFA